MEALQRHHKVFSACFINIHSNWSCECTRNKHSWNRCSEVSMTVTMPCRPAAQLACKLVTNNITKTSNEETLLHKIFIHLHTITHCLYTQTDSLILKSSRHFVRTAILNLCFIKLAFIMGISEYKPKTHLVSQRIKILLFSPLKPVMSEWTVAVCWVSNYFWQVLHHDSCVCVWNKSWSVGRIKTIKASLQLHLTEFTFYVLNLKRYPVQ